MKLVSIKFALLGLALIMTGCNKSSESSNSPLDKIVGIWEWEGYGHIFAVRKDGISQYEITRATCVKAKDYSQDEFAEIITDIEVARDNQSFSATTPFEPSFRLAFRRSPTLPDACAPENLVTAATPRHVFEILWHTFNDYYAFFNERGVDWNQRYADFQGRFTDAMDETALWEALEELLSVINDGHVNLASGDGNKDFSPAAQSALLAILENAFAAQSQVPDLSVFIGTQMDRYFETRTAYLDPGSAQRAAGSIVEWGTIHSDIGYLSLNRMTGLTSTEGASGIAEMLAMQNIMDQVMTDLSGSRAMIIDVRFNSGGDDAVAMAVANRFTDQRRLAMTKTARSYQGESTEQTLYLKPEGATPYLKPVVVIAGPDTVSAAEVFLLAMNTLPQVTLLGETSQGAFSNMLGKTLPNGWLFTLSNEVYRDSLGVSYEAVGRAPEVAVPVFSLADLNAGRNSALDKALTLLGSTVH